MCGYPQFSFWISITFIKIYISCIIINQGKNTFELVGTVLKQEQRQQLRLWFCNYSMSPAMESMYQHSLNKIGENGVDIQTANAKMYRQGLKSST